MTNIIKVGDREDAEILANALAKTVEHPEIAKDWIVMDGTVPPIKEKPVSHELLLRCLYFLYDGFERSMMDFFLIRQTAKDALAGNQLSHHIDIGVRKNEWSSGKGVLFMFFGDEHVKVLSETDDIISCEYQEAPFTIHLYDDNPCLLALNPIVYEYESFKTPNMFERFEREYDQGGDSLEK